MWQLLLILVYAVSDFIFLYIYFSVFSFLIKFVFHYCSIVGSRCSYKPDAKECNDPTSLMSRLPSQLQKDIFITGTTLPRVRSGTLEEPTVLRLLKLASLLAAWIHPTLPLTPFQWVRELNGEQIFDSFRLF